ncbi:hypothetical protein DYI23_02485 [Roseibium polysiphoniae]|uniref:3-deoxy-manno-octulosonate-8-phosphatase n=1 Tax=Roseibium polysiphoniae TaxID=2571221 RepID=A0A944GRY0_9HYPH|nr:HAD hydrolase family protein [Roseibium polysiphoniae]MBS8259075.1 hypothetical protein [Roseibium polysiphoniae]
MSNCSEVAKPIDQIRAVITDFDGVHTDNSVLIGDDGSEFVRCSRADGMGIERLRNRGVYLLMLSREANKVVAARAAKLQMEVAHKVIDKLSFLDNWRKRHGLEWSQIAYIGDDINDLECMKACGLAAAPANAHPEIKQVATILLSRTGGDGAVRELSDLLINGKMLQSAT